MTGGDLDLYARGSGQPPFVYANCSHGCVEDCGYSGCGVKVAIPSLFLLLIIFLPFLTPKYDDDVSPCLVTTETNDWGLVVWCFGSPSLFFFVFFFSWCLVSFSLSSDCSSRSFSLSHSSHSSGVVDLADPYEQLIPGEPCRIRVSYESTTFLSLSFFFLTHTLSLSSPS